MSIGMKGGYNDKLPEGYEAGQIQNFTPEQMNLFKQAFSHVSPDSFTGKLAAGDQEAFAQMERPALQQFNATQGNIASRFSGMGMGGRKSSGFQNATNSAASDFASNLQSQRMGYQQQAIKDLMGMSSELLGQRPYERFMVENQNDQGFNWGGALGGLAGGVGGFMLGGPGGAFAGANAGYNIGSGLSGQQGTGQNISHDWSQRSGVQSNQSPLAAGYDQEFRMNPAAMGY